MRALLPVLLFATPAVAEMSNLQLEARAVIAPKILEAAPAPHGDILTDCIVTNSKRRELKAIAAAAPAEGGKIDDETVDLINVIFARPKTVACATAGLTASK